MSSSSRKSSAGWNDAEGRWNLVVDVIFTNRGTELFELMMKRAHPGPDGFYKIAPEASVYVRLDLGQSDDLPRKGGQVKIRFDHYHHFSDDAVQLVSEPITVELSR